MTISSVNLSGMFFSSLRQNVSNSDMSSGLTSHPDRSEQSISSVIKSLPSAASKKNTRPRFSAACCTISKNRMNAASSESLLNLIPKTSEGAFVSNNPPLSIFRTYLSMHFTHPRSSASISSMVGSEPRSSSGIILESSYSDMPIGWLEPSTAYWASTLSLPLQMRSPTVG